MKRRFFRIAALLAAFIAVALGSAGACPVCYGAPDSASTQGMTAAIFSLLGVTGGVLAVFATAFLRLRRRTRMILAGAAAPGVSPGNAEAGEAESHG